MKKLNLIERLLSYSHEKQKLQRFGRYAVMLIMLLTLGVGQMWGQAKQRYIYCGISNNFDTYKNASDWGFNFWGGTSEGVKTPTYIANWDHDGRTYHVYRVQVYDNNNKAQFKGNSNWWIPEGGYSVTLNGTTNNAVFFSASDDGWDGQFQENYQVESTASLSATSTSIAVGGTSTLTPSLSSNSTYNDIKSTSYSVTTNPGGTGSVTSAGLFSATAAGTYTVTATVTYNAKDFSDITKTTTATKTITVYAPITLNLNGGGNQAGQTATTSINAIKGNTATSIAVAKLPVKSGNGFDGYWTGSGGTGTQVINERGAWISGVSGYTDGSGNWICTTGSTLYARWRATGYYVVGQFNSWKAESSNRIDDETNKASVTISKSPFASSDYIAKFKIRQINATPNTDVWYGYGTGGTYTTIGKGSPTSATLGTGDLNEIKLQVYYDGEYVFTFNSGTPNVTVKVPVIEQIQIYEPSESARKGNYDWTGTPATYQRSVTITLDRETYQFKAVADSRFFSKSSGAISRSTTSVTGLTCTGSEGNLSITADLKGDYVFLLDTNPSNRRIVVTYPTQRKVTYSIVTVGGGTGTAGSLTATNDDDGNVNISTLSNYVADGNHVTFTAPTEATGYTWRGWYSTSTPSAADWSSGRLSTNKTYSGVSVSGANLTVYAVYSQNEYNTTVAVAPAGTKATTSPAAGTVAIKQITGTAITATAATDSIFEDWTLSGGVVAFKSPSTSTSNPATFTATNTGGTITANFTPKWTIAGSMYNNFDWSKNSNLLTGYNTVSSKTYATVTIALAANSTYTFKVKDRSLDQDYGWYGIPSGSTADIYYSDDNTYKSVTTASGNQNITLHTAAAGDYVFRFNLTDKELAVDYPTSYQIRFGGYKTEYLEGADGTTEGGSMSATTSGGAVVVNDGDYVPAGASVMISADETAGYHSVAWYNNADFAEGHKYTGSEEHVHVGTDARYIQFTSISEDKTVWLKYKENKLTLYVSPFLASVEVYDVGGSVVKQTIDGLEPIYVGVHTGKKLKVIPDVPYYFTGWELAETPKYNIYKTDGSGAAPAENEDYAEVNVYATSECTSDVATQTLYASCKVLNAIYFRNEKEDHTALWDSVYVGFNATWNDDKSPEGGKKGASTKGKSVYPMEHISGNTWRLYIPRDITRAPYHNVAFFDKGEMRNWDEFYGNNAVYRTDFDVSNENILQMYVPYHESSSTDNKTTYYSKGYWKIFSSATDAGYYLEHRTGEGTYERKGAFESTGPGLITYSLRLDNSSYKDYAIYDANGHRHITLASAGITYSNCSNIGIEMNDAADSKFGLTPTAEGNYVFTLDQNGDQMKLSVDYPVAVNDYVLECVYTDGTSKTTRSDIIKAATAGEKKRYSMFLSNAGSGTLKLRKCTAITDGDPVWDAGNTTNLNQITSVVGSTPGVYQFDIVVSGDVVSEVDSVRLYTGNFYIKTDAAPGGWVAYKRNILDKNTVNFDRTSAATFDNYFCKYFASSDCNIKSVIANDYCNQLSDTVKGDGIARMEDGEPYVPVDGTSIRFTYNSATNETKRAYLGASLANDFMNIEANATPANSVYKSDGTTNIYGASDANRKFSDSGDWVYEIILKAIPGAKAGVTATYTDASSNVHKQILVPIDNTLLDGTGSKKYSIRVVYDFKTNFMMSAFVLDGEEITEALSDFDMLWVRHKDDAAQQVRLGDGGSMTNVRVIGAVEFQYNEMYWLSESGSKVDLSSWTPINRPYLKYFISFPFDVEMNSIFGLNQSYYGLDYVIQKYDGTKRAKDGLFLGDGDNYWVNMEMGDTLKANEGYCLILDNDYASGRFGRWWDNKEAGSSVYLYFPAMKKIASITATGSTVVPEHTCTIDRTWGDGGKKNHMNTDSHWNMIGSPLFCNAYIKDTTASSPYHMSSYYELNYETNKWEAKATRETPCFKAMSSRFVQWYGTIGWTNDAEQNIFKAPRRAAENENYFAKIEVTLNNQRDYTYLEMIDGADKGFILREDMMKFYNSGVPQICTFAEGYDVAYNKLPVENTTVALGLVARKNGTYTFSMPNNFSGTVTLIDNFAQTRTNLNIEDYEVYLNKGTINDRFELEINVNNAPTAIDGVTDGSGSLKDGKAHKFIMNDMMYILRDGEIFDARGNRVR